MRRMPYLKDIWVASGEVAHVSIPVPVEDQTSNEESPITSAGQEARDFRSSAAMESISALMEKTRGQREFNSARKRRTRRSNTLYGSTVAEQLQKRQPQLDRLDRYNIICKARDAPRSDGMFYMSIKPIPIIFIFMAMVLACTTVIDWAVDCYQQYAQRVELAGEERPMYALMGDCEKRAEAAEAAARLEDVD